MENKKENLIIIDLNNVLIPDVWEIAKYKSIGKNGFLKTEYIDVCHLLGVKKKYVEKKMSDLIEKSIINCAPFPNVENAMNVFGGMENTKIYAYMDILGGVNQRLIEHALRAKPGMNKVENYIFTNSTKIKESRLYDISREYNKKSNLFIVSNDYFGLMNLENMGFKRVFVSNGVKIEIPDDKMGLYRLPDILTFARKISSENIKTK